MQIRSKYILGLLCLVAATVWLAVSVLPEKNLHLIACDVGQGDAILAVYGNTQILFDGGPGSSVLSCLGRHMPFWDREIEAVSLSHPQTDHYQGLIEVFRNYKVDNFIATPLDSSNQGYQVLKEEVGGSAARIVNPTAGMVIRFSSIYLDMVHPSKEYLTLNGEYEEYQRGANLGSGVLGAYTSKLNPNDFSVVAILRFRDFSALMTGDMGPEISEEILTRVQLDDVDYIKIPHHGSKNGLTEELLKSASPKIAIISVGKDNSYGHPNNEVLDMLTRYGVRVFRTDEDGDIEVVTDGQNIKVY